jgi:type I restriction enzyme S subunit
MLALSAYTGLGVKDYEHEESRRTADESATYSVVNPGDIVFNPMWAYKGAVAVSRLNHLGIVSPAYYVMRPSGAVDSRFLAYMLGTSRWREIYAAMARGLTTYDRSVKWDDLAACRIALPGDAGEQCAIADFLDVECARIAAVREETRAFGGDVRLGVATGLEERLLNIRQRFPLRKLSWDIELSGGFAFESEGFVHDAELGVRLLRGTNVTPTGTRWHDVVYWPHERRVEASRFELRAGDLVVGLNRPWVQGGLRSAIIGEDDLPALLLQRVGRLRPRAGRSLTMEYVRLWLQTSHFRHAVRDDAAVTFPMLEPDRLLAYRLPMPPRAEQDALVRRADSAHLRLRSLRRELDALDDDLESYRDALIS